MKEKPEIIFHLSDSQTHQQHQIKGSLKKQDFEDFLDTQIPLSDLSYEINIFKAKDDLFVNGHVLCSLEDLCYRCLKPTAVEIKGIIEATYVYGNENDTINKEKELESLENVIYYVGSEIDLFDRVIEALITAIPQRFLCDENCKGLCPFCGEDLNENPDHTCEQADLFEEENVFSSLSALKDNLKDDQENNQNG
ncbi:MAG: YceD family protein [Thermotogota bacterium]